MTPGGAGKNQQGLSITELMISLALAGVVMGALSSLFISKQKVLGIQDQKAEMHQAARVAMDSMVREFCMIGHGVPNSTWDGCAAPCPPPKIKHPPTPNDTSITFRGNLDATRTTLASNHVSGLTPLTVDSASGFNVNDTIYVEGQTYATAPYTTHWHTATVTATSATTLTISAGLNFEYVNGSTVHVIQDITYSFNNSTKQIRRNNQPLAEYIDGFTLSYIFEDSDTGLPNDVDTDTTNNTSNIRTISISVTARTPKPDPAYKQNSGYRLVTVTSQVTPRNLP